MIFDATNIIRLAIGQVDPVLKPFLFDSCISLTIGCRPASPEPDPSTGGERTSAPPYTRRNPRYTRRTTGEGTVYWTEDWTVPGQTPAPAEGGQISAHAASHGPEQH